jgi:hypothetical protein
MKRNPIMMYRNVIICCFLVFAYGCSDSNNDDGFGLLPAVPEPTPIQPASAGQPGWLYAQTAATAQMTSDTVLEIPFTRDVFGFTDRPDREHAYLTAFEFASLWTAEGANSFSADAPNAVLTWQVGEEQREAEVIINNATVYSDGVKESLVYEVTLETEQMPDAQMSSVSLFVDSAVGPAASGVQVCSATSCTTANSAAEFKQLLEAQIAEYDNYKTGTYVKLFCLSVAPDDRCWFDENCLDVVGQLCPVLWWTRPHNLYVIGNPAESGTP